MTASGSHPAGGRRGASSQNAWPCPPRRGPRRLGELEPGRGTRRCWRSESFDLLVVDNRMPEMSGLELIRELAASAPESERPADPDDDRARDRRERDRGDEARRLRLSSEAVRGRRAPGGGRDGALEHQRLRSEHRVPAERAEERVRPLRNRRPQPRHSGGDREAGTGGAVEEHGAHHRGDGHRQGARRARHPRPERPAGDAAHQGQLRRHPRDPPRVRALRPRAGRLHRRHVEQEGQVRARRRRDDLPRRDRDDEPGAPGEAPARAAGTGVRAAGLGAHGEGRRAGHRRHQPRPADRWWPPALSRRISTTG